MKRYHTRVTSRFLLPAPFDAAILRGRNGQVNEANRADRAGFLELLEELGIGCRLGHPAEIRAAETRQQKHDRRDAEVILELLLMRDRFPEIWMPSREQRDLRTLLRDRHQWVKMRSRLQHTLQAIALNHAPRKGSALRTAVGRQALQRLVLPDPRKDGMSCCGCNWISGFNNWTSKWRGKREKGHRHAGC